MTDRYLFRGKRISDGEWIIGDLFMQYEPHDPQIYDRKGRPREFRGYFDVDRATIGQCTGLYDKNSSPIYEGDIILLSLTPSRDVEGIVMRDDMNAGFSIMVRKIRYAVTMARMSGEIVGNIHDNPELLPEGEK